MNQEELIEKEAVDLRVYLQVIHKRKWLVSVTFIICMALVVLYTYTTVPIYKASSEIMVKEGDSHLLSQYGYRSEDWELMVTQSRVIKSIPVAQKVVQKLNLVDNYDAFFERVDNRITPKGMLSAVIRWAEQLWATTLKMIGLVESTTGLRGGTLPEMTRDEPLPKEKKIAMVLSDGLEVIPVRGSKIIEINYVSTNPVLARMVANTVTEAYIDRIMEMKVEASGYTLRWLTQKVDEERRRLKQSEMALQQYLKAQEILPADTGRTIAPQKMTELNLQLNTAETKRRELQAIYQKVQALNGDDSAAESILMIAADPAIQRLRGMILDAEKRIQDLSKKYKARHPVMVQATSDLKVIREKRKLEIKRVASLIKNEYDLALTNEKNLSRRLAQTKQDAINQNEKSVQYNILLREAEANRQLYNDLLATLKEYGAAEQAKSINVWVVEEAVTPTTPTSPRKRLNLIVGIVLGLFCGIGLALFLENIDTTLKYPDEVQNRFRLPVLSTIPQIKNNKGMVELATLDSTAFAFGESYNTIRTGIMLSSAGGPPRKLLVTSMSPGDGKTTTAVNLAIVFAQAGKKTLLIDTDMRRPRIHTLFKLDNLKALSSYLAGTIDQLSPCQIDTVANLHVIPSGPVPPNPSQLLTSDRFRRFLDTAGKQYDLIVFDSAPVLLVSDALILSSLADGTLIVARAGKATRGAVAKGLEKLAQVNASLMGFVLNQVVLDRSNYYYYDNYYDDYRASKEG